MVFLTVIIAKMSKKLMVKTVKKWFFIKLNLNSMASYFEITLSFRTLYKGFRTIFVFKFGPKTKKFTPKWQIPLFEKQMKRNMCVRVLFLPWLISVSNFWVKIGALVRPHLSSWTGFD